MTICTPVAQEPIPPLTICTVRPTVLGQRCASAQLPACFLVPQQQRHAPLDVLPGCAPPFLIDTVDMPPLLLAALLAQVEQQYAPHRIGRQSSTWRPVIGAILDPADLVRARLVALARAICLLVSEALPWATLVPWAQQLPILDLAPFSPAIAVGMRRPRCPDLPEQFLPILAALPYAVSQDAVAEHYSVSTATVGRVLIKARAALGLSGEHTRHERPAVLAEALVAGLGRAEVREALSPQERMVMRLRGEL